MFRAGCSRLGSAAAFEPATQIVEIDRLLLRAEQLFAQRHHILTRELRASLASRFRDGIGASHLLGWVMLAAALCLIIPPLLSAALFIPFWAWWLRSRIGGISGDGHGAGIELVESGLLLALVLAR